VTATPREFDIVLYGATGFAGKLTAEYLARAGAGARIALAGRSTDRLRAVRDTLGEAAQSWPVLTADAASPSTLNEMAARTGSSSIPDRFDCVERGMPTTSGGPHRTR
jgi:short subunit dehydrogenase-like uncharacterized protein